MNKLIIGLVCLALVSVGCIKPPKGSDGGDKPSIHAYDIELSFSEEPELGKDVMLTMMLTPRPSYTQDLRHVTLQILLPKGIEYVDGDLYWNGTIKSGENRKIQTKVKIAEEGDWTIKGVGVQGGIFFNGTIYPTGGYTELENIYLKVTKDKTEVLTTRPIKKGDFSTKAGAAYLGPGPLNLSDQKPTEANPHLYFSLPSSLNQTAHPIGEGQFEHIFNQNLLGQTLDLTFTFTPRIEVKKLSMNILLPDGIEHVGGDISWIGDTKERVELTAKVKVVKPGNWVISGVLENPSRETYYAFTEDNLVLTVFNESGHLRRIGRYISHPIIVPKSSAAGKPQIPMLINLSFAFEPKPGQEVPLVFSATPLIDAPNTTLSISLPPQFRFVSGDLSWRGDLKKGETARITAIVEPVEKGRGKIRARAVSKISEDFTLGKDASLPVQVSNESVVLELDKLRKMGPLSKEEARNLTRSKATKIGEDMIKISFSSETSLQVAAASLVTISGRWYY